MIRKPPLRTYLKKKTGQSSICYSQSYNNLREQRSFSKRISTNGQKNKAHDDNKTIDDLSSSCLDDTFDRIAKTARLPPPPQQESYNSINISSDVPLNEISPVKTEVYEFQRSKEAGKSKGRKRARRKPAQPRSVYVETEVVVKKRLKRDLMNISTKKDKGVRNLGRKVSAKTDKNLTDSKTTEEIHGLCSTLGNSLDWFVKQPVKNTAKAEEQKERNVRRSRKKINVKRISSSSSDSDSKNCDGDINKVKTKSKKKNFVSRRNAIRGKLKISDFVDTSLRDVEVGDKDDGEAKDCAIERLQDAKNEKIPIIDSYYSQTISTNRISTISNRTRSKATVKNSSALGYVKNFRRYSKSKSEEYSEADPVDSHKYKKILTRKQYTTKTQSKTRRKNNAYEPIDLLEDFNNSNTCENNVSHKKDSKNVQPSSVILLEKNKNKNTIRNRKKSAPVKQNYNNHSSKDIFQSSISNVPSIIERETNDAIKLGLHESTEIQRARLNENQSDFASNLNLDIRSDESKIAKEMIDNKLRCDPNRSLHYLKCSTPINTRVKIDKTINFLSPITATDDTFQKDRKFADEKEVSEISTVNCHTNITSRRREFADLPKTNMRRKSTRKKLNISYEEDKSSEMSDEYCKENVIEKTSVENVENREYSLEQMQSPTSQIQESLEMLKLNLENSINKSNTVTKTKSRSSSQKEIIPIDNDGSNRISKSKNKFDNTKAFTGQSTDSYSQSTPVGIITTRSGRQLKLSTTMQKNFLNESHDTDSEIIDDSETERNRSLRNRVTKHRGGRFTAWKSSYSKHNTSEGMKGSDSTDMFAGYENDSSKIQSAVNISKQEASDSSTSHKSRNLNSPKKSKSMSLRRRGDYSTPESGKESRINDSTSCFDDERNNTTMSGVADPENGYATSYNEEISQNIEESMKNLDSLNIRSIHSDVITEILSDDDNTDESEWSTLSNSGMVDSITSNPEDKIKENSYEENQFTNPSSNPSRSLLISDRSKLDNDLSKESGSRIKSPPGRSPKYTDIALLERMKLLSSRINTRKRRKTVLKPSTGNVSQVFEPEVVIQTSDNSKLTNFLDVCSKDGSDLQEDEDIDNTSDPLDNPKGSELYKDPLRIHKNIHFQPIVLLEKLEDPLKITLNERENWGFGLPAISETLNKTLPTISRDSNYVIAPNDAKVNENDEDIAESDPLYCGLERPVKDKSSLRANRTSILYADSGLSKLDLSVPELITRQSIIESLHQCLLRRSHNSSYRSRRKSLPRKSKKICNQASTYECSISRLDGLFVKPGKEYARSLSILNSIQNGSVLEQLSMGKGKKWRNSVVTILAMQEEGLVQSCFGKNEDDKDTQPRFRALSCVAIPETQPCSEEQSVGSASPSRFIRRMSIRVVPDNKRRTQIEDTSFLEAYGITASKSRKTLCKSSEIKSGEKTLPDNVKCVDTAIEFVKTERIITPRDVVLERCNQDYYLPFSKCFPSSYLENCRKIGEGVYGEVFLYETREQQSVIKIIPIEGETLVNGERQKRFDEILSEIVIAKELHNLRHGDKYQTHGFVEVKNIRCIIGKYPEKLIELWKDYDNNKGSDNDCPSMFDKNQLYIVLELGHAGEDLEAFVFDSADEALALFVQIAVALAVAEQSLEFEHRDLHWGNVLISETKETDIAYRLNDEEYKYPTKGLQVAIIDFTLSRMSYDGCCIFNDLALDPALFTAQGEYQFEIYRLMQKKVRNNWQEFEPYTNILWLHYTIDKIMTSARYTRKYARIHREAMFVLHGLKKILLDYKSAFDFVMNCEKIKSFRCKNETETVTKTTETPVIKID